MISNNFRIIKNSKYLKIIWRKKIAYFKNKVEAEKRITNNLWAITNVYFPDNNNSQNKRSNRNRNRKYNNNLIEVNKNLVLF